MPKYLAIEIGGTKLQVAVGNSAGKILERHRFAVTPSAGGAGIRKQLKATLPALIKKQRPVSIGVGFGGPVDWKTGKICCSHQIEGWSDFPLQRWLEDLTGIATRVDNDANVGALGEATRGAGVGFNPVFYVTLGSGVGGGLVVDGKIYHGAKPGESEIGHIRLDKSGKILELSCSGWAVDKKIRASKLGDHAKELKLALAKNNPIAKKILNETATDLAFGLSHVVHLFHPEVIILGGGLSLIGEPLRKAVATALSGFIMEAFAPGPKIVLAKLGEDAVPVGALALARVQPSDRSPRPTR